MGDRTFEALMSDHHAEIYRYVLRVTGRRQDADDLAQETFLRAFRAHRTLPPDANSPGLALRDRDEPHPEPLPVAEAAPRWPTPRW